MQLWHSACFESYLPLPPGQAKPPHLSSPSSSIRSRHPRVSSFSSQEIKGLLCTHLLAKPRPAAGAPPPAGECGAAAQWAHAFPYLTWTNACRQSQEFRPLTSASSSQGTARETEGRGWGRWGGRRGKGTNQQPLQPCRSFTFCLWVRSRARASFPGINSFSEQGRAGRCKVRAGCRARARARGAVRGAGPGLSGAGDNGKGSARAPPPLPLPPPPAAAAAAAPAASSQRYCCKSSFLPLTLRPRAPREPPALPRRERLRGGWSAGRRAPSARLGRAAGPAVRKCRPLRNHGVHVLGEGDPEFLRKR